MPNRRSLPRTGRIRLRWILTAAAVVIVAAASAYVLFGYQRQQNTLKLLRDAEAATADGNWPDAVAAYRLYLRRSPEDTAALSAYADALLECAKATPDGERKGSPALIGHAVSALQKLIRLDPDDSEAVSKLAALYLDLQDHAAAEGLARTWVEKMPGSADAAIALARAHHGLHQDVGAAEVLIKAIERMPGEARLYPPLIELLAKPLDRPDEAAGWLDKALEVGPDNVQVQMAAFSFHRGRGDLATAEEHLHRALTLTPEAADVLARAILFHVSRDRLEEAEALLDRAGNSASSNRLMLAARAALAVKKDNPAELEAAADQLTEAAADADLDLIAQAAELYLRAGRFNRVDECIEKLAAATRDTGRGGVWLETLRGARALFDEKPYVAIPHLQQALRQQPSNRWAMELLALAYQTSGAFDEAADLYRRAIVLSSDVDAMRLALARLELRRGRYEEARSQIEAEVRDATVRERGTRSAELIRLASRLYELPPDARDSTRQGELMLTLERLAAAPAEDTATAELLSTCFLLLNQPERALEVMRGWISQPAVSAAAASELNRMLVDAQRFEIADKWAAELIERFPEAMDGYALRMRVLVSSGPLEQAASYAESCPLEESRKGELWSLLADAYLNVDKGELGLAALRRAIALQPENVAARQALIRHTSSPDEAAGAIEQIREIEGDEGVHWRYERAWTLLRSDPTPKDLREAMDLLRECLAVRSGWVSARMLLGFAQETAGLLTDAAESYRMARAQRPELAADPGAIRFVEVLKKLGRFEEADGALARLETALPESPEVLRLTLDKHLRRRKLDSAAATAERLLYLREDDPAWAAIAADLQLRAGDASKAEEIARAARDRHPDSSSVLWSLARAVVAQGRAEEAETLLAEAAASSGQAEHSLLLAGLLVRLNKGEQAEQAVVAAMAAKPDDPAVCAAASDFWGARGDRARQLELARRAVTLRGESPADSLALAALLAAGASPAERAEAREIVQRRLGVDPKEVPSLLLSAHLAGLAEPPDLSRAEETVREALAVDPRSVQAHKMLASLQARTGRSSEAGDTVAAALVFTPDDPELLLTSAEIYCHRGEYRQAVTPLHRLLELRPRLPEAQRLLADAYLQAGRVDQGIAELERQAPEEHRSQTETLLLARLYEAAKDYTRAEDLFLRAAELDKRAGEPFQAYLQFLARRDRHADVYSLTSQRRTEFPGDLASVIAAGEILGGRAHDPQLQRTGILWLTEIAGRHPDRAADVAFRIGLCHYQQGDLVNAETMFLKASTLVPSAPRPANALAWLYSEDLGQADRALALLENYLARGGAPSAEMLDTLACALIRLGRLEEAREKLRTCIALAGQTPTLTAAHYHLGRALLETPTPDAGRSYIRQALELDERLGGLTPKDKQEARRLITLPTSTAGGVSD